MNVFNVVSDRPDLDRKRRVNEITRRLADVLGIGTRDLEEWIESITANPIIDAAAVVLSALKDRQATPELRRSLVDLLLPELVEINMELNAERTHDDTRPKEASPEDQSGPRREIEPTVPIRRHEDDWDEEPPEYGDAWEGDER